jgi:hypothetical protein
MQKNVGWWSQRKQEAYCSRDDSLSFSTCWNLITIFNNNNNNNNI